MPTLKRPRKGSLQFYPRKRIDKRVPSVNWQIISKKNPKGLLGFITYKVGMATAVVKDSTDKGMTSGKLIAMPVTILEVPHMKIFSVRFYKNSKVLKDVIVSNEKDLKRIVRIPKTLKTFDSEVPKDFDDVRAIVYSLPRQIGLKKAPDITEVAIGAEDKLAFVKTLIGKEISINDFGKHDLLDVRGLTTGHGLSGPVKRHGISLKNHKSEKGVRRPGSLGPWHPARVTFRTPMAGQLGMFTRVHYNLKVIGVSTISEKNINPKQGFRHYGNIKADYLILKGSVQGPQKRQILVTPSFRPTKMTAKRKYELVEVASQ